MLKNLIKKVKNAYLNAKFERGNTKFLGKCYILETEDYYTYFKVAVVRDNCDDATCLVLHLPKDPEPCKNTYNDTGKYIYRTDSLDVPIPYTNMYINFQDIPLFDIKNFTEVTNEEFNDTIKCATNLLMSLNLCHEDK